MISDEMILDKYKRLINKFSLVFGKKRKNIKDKFLIKNFDLNDLSGNTRFLLKGLNSNGVIWAGSKIADELGFQEAIRFVENNATDKQLLAVKLFYANANICSEQSWLEHLNDYLNLFSLAPISLNNGSGTRFDRLSTEVSLDKVDGVLVSVIMPAYNAENTLMKAAQSILAQTWRNLELIIVDDCSTDGTWEIAQQLSKLDSRVIIFRNVVNVGPYVSKNLALWLAKGKYVTGQDADDWSHPQRLVHDIEVLNSSEGRVLANLSCMLRMTLKGEFTGFARLGASSKDGVSRVASISLMIDTKFLREVLGGWDSVRFSADSELINRIESVIGDRFQRSENISMICLDLETSLTNDPEHGVSRVTGISPVRKIYRESYTEWHKKLMKNEATLPFPPRERYFDAPDVMRVPLKEIELNFQKLKEIYERSD